MGSATGELRLYALGIQELLGIVAADERRAEELRAVARKAFTISPAPAPIGLIGKLGPLFRRPPGTPVISPTQPEPRDVDVLLAGAYVPPDRMGATWRVLEVLVHAQAWGSTKIALSAPALDDLDFALARGGVSAAAGLRHLINQPTGISLRAVEGLTVGWHRYDQALGMAGAYRLATPAIKTPDQQELVSGLVRWLDGFAQWARLAGDLGRPVPDLIGFWAA